jgi:hypothetical protein
MTVRKGKASLSHSPAGESGTIKKSRRRLFIGRRAIYGVDHGEDGGDIMNLVPADEVLPLWFRRLTDRVHC